MPCHSYNQDDANVQGVFTFTRELVKTTSDILMSAKGLGVDKMNEDFRIIGEWRQFPLDLQGL